MRVHPHMFLRARRRQRRNPDLSAGHFESSPWHPHSSFASSTGFRAPDELQEFSDLPPTLPGCATSLHYSCPLMKTTALFLQDCRAGFYLSGLRELLRSPEEHSHRILYIPVPAISPGNRYQPPAGRMAHRSTSQGWQGKFQIHPRGVYLGDID